MLLQCIPWILNSENLTQYMMTIFGWFMLEFFSFYICMPFIHSTCITFHDCVLTLILCHISHVFMHFYNEVLDLSYCACICRINLFNIEYELLLHTISYVIIIWGYFLLENEQFLFTLNKRNSNECIITLIYSITCTCI